MNTKGLKVGDRIEFKACTRSHFRKAIRVITSVNKWNGAICVRYHGCGDFALYPREIIRLVESA